MQTLKPVFTADMQKNCVYIKHKRERVLKKLTYTL